MTTLTITIGPVLFTFTDVTDWRSGFYKYRRHGANLPVLHTLAIDANGRVCVRGCDFIEASYPVTVYAIPADFVFPERKPIREVDL
jgi:hypothetical protein